MADVAKRIVGPALLSTSSTVLYTTPAATTTIVRSIHVSNSSGTTYQFSLSIGGASGVAASQFFGSFYIGPQNVLDWSGFLVLNATDSLQASGTNAASLTITVSGVEVT